MQRYSCIGLKQVGSCKFQDRVEKNVKICATIRSSKQELGIYGDGLESQRYQFFHIN